MQPNKNIQIELTPFEAKQLKQFTKIHHIHLLILLVSGGVFVGLLGFMVLAIIKKQILLGFLGVFTCAYSLNELFFTDTSGLNGMKGIKVD